MTTTTAYDVRWTFKVNTGERVLDRTLAVTVRDAASADAAIATAMRTTFTTTRPADATATARTVPALTAPAPVRQPVFIRPSARPRRATRTR